MSRSDSVIPSALFTFLSELKANNDRDWFAENKHRYHRDVRDPAVELVARLQRPLARTAPMLNVIPKPHNGSVMRIYRDTRFGKNKQPYKTNVGISLRHQAGKDVHAPGIYIHLDPDECFLGAGCWRPEPAVLAAIRARIDAEPAAWKRAKNQKTFRQHYELAGEQLKTSPRDYPSDHPLIEDLRRKDFIAVTPISHQQMTAGGIVELLVDRIKQARPLMRFLCDAIDVPY